MTAFSDFENRIAVVTGAASGIGREILFQLVRRGTHVAACDIDSGKLEAVAHRARTGNREVRVTTHVHDVSDEKEVGRFVKQVAREHGCDAVHMLF